MRPFYTAKPVQSLFGTPGNFTALPVLNRDGAGFLGSLENAELRTESRPLQNHVHTTNVFIFFMIQETRIQE